MDKRFLTLISKGVGRAWPLTSWEQGCGEDAGAGNRKHKTRKKKPFREHKEIFVGKKRCSRLPLILSLH